MAHDANFVGNRLRLSAFLLCVEHGIPTPPARFRRPLQILDSVRFPAPAPPGVYPVLEAYNEPTFLVSRLSLQAGNEESATIDKPLQTEFGEDQTLLDGLTKAPSAYKITHSPTPDAHLTPASTNNQDSHNGLASTRKRRLPVHELALLRTTTLDGLPAPSDATVNFAAPITALDPIEDCRINPAETRHRPTAVNVVTANSKLSLPTAQPSSSPSSSRTTPMKSLTNPCQGLTQVSVDIPRHRRDFRDAFDGFVGTELKFTSKKRRRKANPTKRQQSSTMRELNLGVGLPPVSGGWDTAPITPSGVDETSNPDGGSTSSRSKDAQPDPRPGQLILTRR